MWQVGQSECENVQEIVWPRIHGSAEVHALSKGASVGRAFANVRTSCSTFAKGLKHLLISRHLPNLKRFSGSSWWALALHLSHRRTFGFLFGIAQGLVVDVVCWLHQKLKVARVAQR